MSTTTETKTTPIDLHAHEVRGILDGRQTQFRRVIEPQPPAMFLEGDVAAITNGTRWAFSRVYSPGRGVAFPADPEPGFLCPFGAPGDVLWGREPFVIDHRPDRNQTWVLSADRRRILGPGCPLHGKTDFPDGLYPSEQMQKWASVLWLEIESVRVERVWDISQEDAAAEGLEPFPSGTGYFNPTTPPEFRKDGTGFSRAAAAYRVLWEHINGYGSWDGNPWVWCLTFKRV